MWYSPKWRYRVTRIWLKSLFLFSLRTKSILVALWNYDWTPDVTIGTTWGWVINDRIFIFGWTIPLTTCSFELELPGTSHTTSLSLLLFSEISAGELHFTECRGLFNSAFINYDIPAFKRVVSFKNLSYVCFFCRPRFETLKRFMLAIIKQISLNKVNNYAKNQWQTFTNYI